MPSDSETEMADRRTSDWGRDLNIFDERYVTDPSPVWRELRSECPIAFSERTGRSWMPVDYDAIASIAHNTDAFSSRRIAVVNPRRWRTSRYSRRHRSPRIRPSTRGRAGSCSPRFPHGVSTR